MTSLPVLGRVIQDGHVRARSACGAPTQVDAPHARERSTETQSASVALLANRNCASCSEEHPESADECAAKAGLS